MWSHITTMQRAFFTLQLLWVSIATECLCSLNLAFMLPPLSCQCKSSFTQHMNRRWKFNLQILFVFGLALHLASGFVYVHVYVNMLNCSFSNAWGHTHLLELQPVCRYGLYIWHFTQTNCVTCCRNAVAVYTICWVHAYQNRESTQIERNRIMESLTFLAVMLSTILSGTVGNV